jgi:1-acyl-sn-glycerol-3-phosphate acyltransferase
VLRPTQWYHAYAVAAQDYFFRNFFKALAAVVLANAMPFDRKEDPAKSLELCAEVLQVSRDAIIMFPEGTRSVDGSLQMFRPGVGRLVAGTDIPVIPAYIHGAHRAWPKGYRFPKPRRVTLVIGQPRRYAHVPSTQEGHILIANDLREAVLQLRSSMGRK